jgi:hypothetical protein
MLAGAAHADCPRFVSLSSYITRVLGWFGFGKCIIGVNHYNAFDRPRSSSVKAMLGIEW